MSETRAVNCLSCGRELWRTTWPTPTRVTGGCCIPRYTGPMPQPIPGGIDANGNGIVLGHAQYGGGTVEQEPGTPAFLARHGFGRWSCPWRECQTTTLWRLANADGTPAVRPAMCGRCGRSLDRGCVRCLTLVWFAPADARCRTCGGALTSTLTVARAA